MNRRLVLFLVIAIVIITAASIAPVLMRPHFALMSRGKAVAVDVDKTVNGNILVVGADARIAGTVNGSVIVRHGNMLVVGTGRITHDAVVIDGQLHVEKTSRIGGKRVTSAHSVFGRGRHAEGPGGFLLGRVPVHMLAVPMILLGILIGFSIVLARGRHVLIERLSSAIEDNTLTVILTGILTQVALLFLFRLIGRSLEFPLVAVPGLFLGIITSLSAIVPGKVFGKHLGKLLRLNLNAIQQMALGSILIGLGIFLPFIGRFILIAFSAIGIGSMLVVARKQSVIQGVLPTSGDQDHRL